MKIGLVNDSELALEAMRRVVTSAGKHHVAWIARDGAEAVARCAQERPDLVLMDLVMPKMGGVEATRRIMEQSPCPILVVTATVEGNASKAFEAMSAGALDAVTTPVLDLRGAPTGASALLSKIETIGKLTRERARMNGVEPTGEAHAFSRCGQLIAIGSSAGGPAALAQVLRELPANLSAAVVIVQHVDAQFAPGLASWLASASKLPVRVVVPGDRPEPGTVLVAATNDHLVFESPRELSYTREPANEPYRPSVDVFFESVARFWRGKVIAVVLTGMGRDGAKGLKMLRRLGHHTIAQDETSSAVYGMPKAAAELDAAVEILPLQQIPLALMNRIQSPLRLNLNPVRL